MATRERVWATDSIDAVSITLTNGDVAVAASEDGHIHIDGADERDGFAQAGIDRIEQVGRWLLVHLMQRRGGEPLSVYLPRSKSWQLDVQTGHGDVGASEIQGRLHIMTGQGDVHLAHCQGVFDVGAGAGDIELVHCRQADAPAACPLPQATPDSGIPAGAQREGWLASPARSIAAAMATLERRLARLPGRAAADDSAGVTINGGSGDVQTEDLDATVCSIRIGRGDVSLEDGHIGRLSVSAGQGDVDCEGVTPLGQWDIETVQGDITLKLPANVPLRLDAATSHGDLHSDAPLVRVARPGPESRHGGRMVGSYGRADAQSPQIRLTTSKGDIEIALADDEPREVGGRGDATEDWSIPERETATSSEPAVSSRAGDATPGSEMDVLKALSDGLIDAAEAERLLRSMGA